VEVNDMSQLAIEEFDFEGFIRGEYLRPVTRSPVDLDKARDFLEQTAGEPVLTTRQARQKSLLNPLAIAAATLRWARLQEPDSELCRDWFSLLDAAAESGGAG
jgi:hypothetical protein